MSKSINRRGGIFVMTVVSACSIIYLYLRLLRWQLFVDPLGAYICSR